MGFVLVYNFSVNTRLLSPGSAKATQSIFLLPHEFAYPQGIFCLFYFHLLGLILFYFGAITGKYGVLAKEELKRQEGKGE